MFSKAVSFDSRRLFWRKGKKAKKYAGQFRSTKVGHSGQARSCTPLQMHKVMKAFNKLHYIFLLVWLLVLIVTVGCCRAPLSH